MVYTNLLMFHQDFSVELSPDTILHFPVMNPQEFYNFMVDLKLFNSVILCSDSHCQNDIDLMDIEIPISISVPSSVCLH